MAHKTPQNSVGFLFLSWIAINSSYRHTEKLLVTTVTEVSPPFRGVPQIWRSRSGYKSIAVSFCDQLVCSRLLATQTRTSARDPVSSARGVRSELAEGGTSAPLGRRGGFPAVANRRVSTVFRPYPRVCRAENCISAPQLGREVHSRPKNLNFVSVRTIKEGSSSARLALTSLTCCHRQF